MKRKLPLHLQIILGMILGILAGVAALHLGAASFVTNWITPIGTIFINLLKMVAVPLVFVSMIKGITGLGEMSTLSTLGIRTLLLYVGTTVVAIVLGVCMVSVVQPGKIFPQERAIALQAEYSEVVSERALAAEEFQEGSPLDFLVNIVPDNIVQSMGNNSNMLQVIFLAVLVGIAMVAVGKATSLPLLELVDSLNAILLRIIDFIMSLAPYGVFALMSSLAIDSAGESRLFVALGAYALTVVVSLLILMYLFYPLLIRLFTPIGVKRFIKAAAPVQLLGFTTSSSAATLPVTMEQSQKELGLSATVTSFVLPVGVTINMDGTSCYQAIAALFIAQVMGIELSVAEILTIISITVISSIGTPGIPGGSVVMLVMVLTSVGIPPEGLALILGIDRPLDMLRTSVNVTGDMSVAAIVQHHTK